MKIEFDFTYKGLLALLSIDGVNSKGILKKAFETASVNQLLRFKNSIPIDIKKIHGKGISKVFFDEKNLDKEVKKQ